ncbi:hypothetical protein SAMN04488008_102434 [Maribacter orientalis]|uniref:Adhesin n=1 Tax=Maribacter orientalis TaxID=228957 RepID=A0A1H7KYJ1_9FLAO|nr:DUF4097 family beta strand repeat-containing protein [Maribacter orientalis]SEK91802.1 hypothetical protein SAMN04488008_102434 [Maribacter orientalis]
MKTCIVCCLLLLSFTLKGQKNLYRTISANDISLIQVNAANCFKVEFHTGDSNEITIEAEIEGEYSQDLDLEVNTSGTTVLIEAGFAPSFEYPNDKLSAHKVVSILLKLTIPSFKEVEVYGTNSRVILEGKYKELDVSLSDGECELHNILGNANVKTQSGTINVFAKSAQINANSKYGKVSFNPIPEGLFIYKLQTVTGNIELSKTE